MRAARFSRIVAVRLRLDAANSIRPNNISGRLGSIMCLHYYTRPSDRGSGTELVSDRPEFMRFLTERRQSCQSRRNTIQRVRILQDSRALATSDNEHA